MVGHRFCTTELHCPYASLADSNLGCSNFKTVNDSAHEIAKSLFHIGETLLYSNSGHSMLPKVIKIEIINSGKMIICIKTAVSDKLDTMHETL